MDKLVFKVDSNGISAPQFADIFSELQERARGIFGADIDISPDTQDGQLIAIVAAAIHDVNCQAINTYAAFSPATAVGTGLDVAVKTNGLKRRVATHSTVDLRLVGQAGTEILNGYAEDEEGTRWNLPARVSIGRSGETTVTAVADDVGAVGAPAGAVHVIGTPTYGWQSVVNPAPAIMGAAVETDAELRQQQTTSTMLPSVSLFESILSSVENLPGVTRVSGRNNDTAETTAEGIPPHSVAVIAEGGDVAAIAETIFLKKGNGTGTYGSTRSVYQDVYGYEYPVFFSRPRETAVGVRLKIEVEANYVQTVNDEIKARIVAYVNGTDIGTGVRITRVLASAIKHDGVLDTRFTVEGIELQAGSKPWAAADIAAEWDESLSCKPEDVSIEVTSDARK